MVPNRTLPIVGNSTLRTPSGRATPDERSRSILRRLARSLSAHRPVPDPGELAYLVRLDRALDLIEHQTCDCL